MAARQFAKGLDRAIKQAVNAKLEEAAKIVVGYNEFNFQQDEVADRIRKLKED